MGPSPLFRLSIVMLPSIRDFATEAFDPSRYARLGDGWHIAVADVVASTDLANAGRDRDINFVAGAVVAVLSKVAEVQGQAVACQFGGDGAVAAIPPDRTDPVRHALAALAHWSATELHIPLRVGIVPVSELTAAGHPVLVALHDLGAGNVFGQFLDSGIAVAEQWVKADSRWSIAPSEGELDGLESLSCRWRPVPPRRGHILCLIIDPLGDGQDVFADLANLRAEIEAIVPTTAATPLGDGTALTPALLPSWRMLAIESHVVPVLMRPVRLFRAVIGSFLLGAVHRLGGKFASLDVDSYRHAVAVRSDYRKQAGGPRMVIDVTEDEESRLTAALSRAEAQGRIRFGLARSPATTMTCMVGDFSADRHIHFVDGEGLGFWRASEMLKAKRPPA